MPPQWQRIMNLAVSMRAVAEGLIERIGSEIDQRVDARLGVISRESDSSAKVSQAGRQAPGVWTGRSMDALKAVMALTRPPGSESQSLG